MPDNATFKFQQDQKKKKNKKENAKCKLMAVG